LSFVACGGLIYRRLISAEENKQLLLEPSEYFEAELVTALPAAQDVRNGP
jgi:hypothetical protein